MEKQMLMSSAFTDYENARYKFIGYQVLMQGDREVTKRIKFGLGELLSNVGGLYSALFAIGWGLAVLFGHWNM